MCQQSSARTSPGLVSLPGSVQLLHKIMNARTVEHVGIKISKILVIGNIDMWRHPKYYKELRKRNKPAGTGGALCVDPEAGSDQAIRLRESETSAGERSPGPGHKLPDSTMVKQRASSSTSRGQEQQATSNKPQAASSEKNRPQASSPKQQATKSQAASDKHQA